jgi:uncharacterized FlgJ-related protein
MMNNACASVALALALGLALALPASAQEVIVLAGPESAMGWLEAENWWGDEQHGSQLEVPHALVAGINPLWRETSQRLTVRQKKEIFYRLILPLIVHANDMVLERRSRLARLKASLDGGESIAPEDFESLKDGAVLLRVLDQESGAALTADSPELPEIVDELLYRLDVIPNGLALGQAAYESGYGTSRFAVEGNALFGQWTYGGKGLKPEQQRKSLGDHRIAAFDWPFDSVRGYFINLMSHPAYEDFRRMRRELRDAGKPLTSLALADGLIRYSERGAGYVESLKSIIRVNNLDIADGARFRDEPIRFLVGAGTEANAQALRSQIEEMRASGELNQIIARMRLE